MIRIAYVLPLMLAVPLGGQEDVLFEPQPAGDYLCHLTQADVTVAAEPYDEPEKVKSAFGQVDPNQFGFLPILVVVSNDTDRILEASALRVQLVTANGRAIDPTPADKVVAYRSSGRWGRTGPPVRIYPPWAERLPQPVRHWEIGARAFQSEFVSPRSFASGFFYFETSGRDLSGTKLYLRGFKDLPSRKDLMYYEIDLSPYARRRRGQAEGKSFREVSSNSLIPATDHATKP